MAGFGTSRHFVAAHQFGSNRSEADMPWLGYLIAAIELFGGLAILFGIKTRWVACALVAWVVIATALGHPFWTMEGAARAANQANFYKNLAIMAAYLLLAITGAGRYSLDHRAVSAPSKAAAASA
jgi:putative oxidoreductase